VCGGSEAEAVAVAFDQETERKQRFVRALAEYLTADQGERSIGLQLQRKDAVQWAGLRRETPLFGYPTADEAERTLGAFLGVPTPERP
jgi:hypothetical protein